ncbi:MAG: IS21 family transposase [Anaerolineae bacterium]
MPGKTKGTMEIREMLRRFQQGQSNRSIARDLGINRKTVDRYHAWAVEQELLEVPLPSLGGLHQLLEETLNNGSPPQNTSTVEPYRDLVEKLVRDGVEIAATHERLKERGYTGSYASVYRFVRTLEPSDPDVTVRLETRPGEEAQVDFGYAGKMIDPETGELRKTWAFVMTLSWSRHQYVEFVFDQKVETWLRLHRNAFAFFAGVPERVVIDNLKAAIVRACWDDPQAQQSYRECAEHYGFLIAPCRPATPRHKGKVEKGGVHYVKRNFLGGREPTTVPQANRDVRRWAHTTAGQRIHGTTREKPLERFKLEQAALKPLPNTPYDMAVWKQLKLHRDCHLIFEQVYYSAPFRLVGQQLWVRGGTRDVHIYTTDYQLVATHTRARKPGRRVTHLDHMPPHKVPGLILTRETCRQQASEVGPCTRNVVDVLLDHRPEDRLRTAGRLLRLGDRFGHTRLEAACARALRFDDPAYMTIKRILEQGLDAEELPSRPASPSRPMVFARRAEELVGHVMGGVSWK